MSVLCAQHVSFHTNLSIIKHAGQWRRRAYCLVSAEMLCIAEPVYWDSLALVCVIRDEIAIHKQSMHRCTLTLRTFVTNCATVGQTIASVE